MALPHEIPAQSNEGLPWVSPGPLTADAKVSWPWVPAVGRPWEQGAVHPAPSWPQWSSFGLTSAPGVAAATGGHC